MSAISRLSVVVPCYNESKNIPIIVNRFKEAAQAYGGQTAIEIILVDNGSRDDSAQVLQAEVQRAGSGLFRIVTVKDNKGYGFGILSGLRAATGDVLAWTHADMQTEPGDVFKALDVFLSELSKGTSPQSLLVKGRRVGRKFGEWAFTLGMSVISSVILGKVLFDINAQPKLFHKNLFDQIKNPPDDFSLDLYFVYIAKTRGFAIRTVDVVFGKRLHGESKWAFSWKSKYRTILRTIRYIWALRVQIATRGA